MAKLVSKSKSQVLLLLTIALVISVGSGSSKYKYGRIYDITHKITPDLPTFGSNKPLGNFIRPVSSIKNGSLFNSAEFQLGTHTGTHVDAPSHFFQKYYDQGFDVTTVNLYALNGPALVVDVPRDKNITAEVLKSLSLPKGIERVLFKTLNTDRGLMHKKVFDSSYTGFKTDGAQWVVKNTQIKLVGIDYLSISAITDAAPTHHTLMNKMRVIPLEGLNLDGIKPGMYTLHCLPLKIAKADGSQTRCILVK